MADQNVKISSLTSLTGLGANSSSIIPIVDESGTPTTKGITLNELVNFITQPGKLPPTVVNTTTSPTQYVTTAGDSLVQKYYIISDAAPTQPTNGWNNTAKTPSPGTWLDHMPTAGENPGYSVVWSVYGLIYTNGSGLVSPATWSTLFRETKGQISFYNTSDSPPSSPINGDLWFQPDKNNQVFQWNGTTWVNFSVPFPDIDTSGNIKGLIHNQTSSEFAIVADKFEIVIPPGYSGNTGPKISTVPFSITPNTQTGEPQVYISDAIIPNLDAGKITTGTLTVGIRASVADLQSGKMANSFEVYNANNILNTMPATSWGYYRSSITYDNEIFVSPAGVAPADRQGRGGVRAIWPDFNGSPVPCSNVIKWYDNLTFYGWARTDCPLTRLRFGLPVMNFNYSWVGYGDTATDEFRAELVYQIFDVSNNVVRDVQGFGINDGDLYVAQEPPATLNNGALNNIVSQAGGIVLDGLHGDYKIVFGLRCWDEIQTGTPVNDVKLITTQLTISAPNL